MNNENLINTVQWDRKNLINSLIYLLKIIKAVILWRRLRLEKESQVSLYILKKKKSKSYVVKCNKCKLILMIVFLTLLLKSISTDSTLKYTCKNQHSASRVSVVPQFNWMQFGADLQTLSKYRMQFGWAQLTLNLNWNLMSVCRLVSWEYPIVNR